MKIKGWTVCSRNKNCPKIIQLSHDWGGELYWLRCDAEDRRKELVNICAGDKNMMFLVRRAELSIQKKIGD